MPIDPAEVPAAIRGRRVAVLVSGGIAAYKVADIVSQLGQAGCEVRVAMIGEAGGELADDPGESLGLAEQQGAAVGGDVAAVEVGEDFAGPEHGKVEVV